MSAVKIIFKRSSLLGKRPTGANLEAGEIGMNTNSTDPGLFFETNNGTVVKAGPTAYLPGAPTDVPARGELWVDSDTKTLNIGTGLSQWQKVATPFLGGTSGLTVFVAPEYENATDSLANDGQTVPFVTINRAILEVSKQIILDTLSGVSTGNNRYLIFLAPGRHCVVNAPGSTLQSFDVSYENFTQTITSEDLAQFNDSTYGGLILPRGVSIIGLDLKKCEVHPTYVPKYTHPEFPGNYQQEISGPVYENEPPSSVFRWTGNTYASYFTGLDKINDRIVVKVTAQEETNFAIFETERPHGLGFNDFTQINYSEKADQSGGTFVNGAYYAYPLDNFRFLISPTNWDSLDLAPVNVVDLPGNFFTAADTASPKFLVSNIYPYYVPLDGTSYETHPYSHHRLSILKNASLKELDAFYTKVQKAFPTVFGSQVNQNLATTTEYVIVAPTDNLYPNNLNSNSTDNSSPYENQVNHRSDYGMANADFDGKIVSGFKSAIVNSSTAVILQKDPVSYQIYSTANQSWISLTEFTRASLTEELPVTSIPTETQLQNLNEASIPNIRYYFETIKVADPDNGDLKSTGIPDPDNDFRHFGFRCSGSNAFLQAQSTYTIGAAVGCWATDGATVSLTNATTNFGSIAFMAEGFAGIGTLGGANPVSKGFLNAGIQRPVSLLPESVRSDEQKRILKLGSKVIKVETGLDPRVQLIYLQKPFDPASILPYSLKPGSAVYVTSGPCTYRGFFVTDGSPTCILTADPEDNPCGEGAILRLRSADSTIPNGTAALDEIPYIRRYVDPRNDADKSYGFYIQSTSPTTQAPVLGSVLRLNQTGQNLSETIKRNYQFDPGKYGGFGQVFTVDQVLTEQYSLSANFNYKVADANQSANYVVYASLSDASTPWVQSVPSDPTDLESDLVPFSTPLGSYTTYENKNYYAAENNLWEALYYKTTFNPNNGPIKVSPDKSDSPFVISSVLQNAEPVADSWQGYVPDPYYDYYTKGEPSQNGAELTYMRGAVVPYSEYAPQFQIDDDDSSDNFGIIFNTVAVDSASTVLVSDSEVAQTAIAPTSPYAADPSFGRPEILQLNLLAVQQILSPRQGVSILQLSNGDLGVVEYVRVIAITSNVVQVIRNYYPTYAVGDLPKVWPKGSIAKVSVDSEMPEASVYDPDWAVTKATMFRFYELMGYPKALMAPYLEPKSGGERLLLNAQLPLSPINGYARSTSSWPIEFNTASSIYANTHTWQKVGLIDYSRGLPKYNVNLLPNKLAFDYLSTASWGGRLTVMGANETGELVFGGPIKEALTSQFFSTDTPLSAAADRQIYQTPDVVQIPTPVLVYSADDISGEFDGNSTTFYLTRGGYPLPVSQLSVYGMFVFVGGVVQRPGISYSIQGDEDGVVAPAIIFTEAPAEGLSCDIRVVTSDDDNETVEVVDFDLTPQFDGNITTFTAFPSQPTLTNLNSFLFLGGTEQNPSGVNQTSGAYDVTQTPTLTQVSFLGGTPGAGTVYDMRGILSGSKYRNAGVSSVFVASADDIAPRFDGAEKTFALEIEGEPLDPTKVNAENIFVSLGGVMQIPTAQIGDELAGLAYSVDLSPITNTLQIRFATAPLSGTTCNIRIVASDEFLTCPVPDQLLNTAIQDGPGIVLNSKNQITSIDPGTI